MLRGAVFLAFLIGLPVGALASDFWDEVRTPGLAAHVSLLREAEVALRRQQGAVALELLSRSSPLFVEEPRTRLLRGWARCLNGSAGEGLAEIRAALDADPTALTDVGSGARIAVEAGKAGDFVLATRVLRQLVSTMPTQAARGELFALLGDALLAQGPATLPEAISAYREALRDGGGHDVQALLGLAVALHRNGEPEAARELSMRLNAGSRVDVLVPGLALPSAERAARLALASEALAAPDAALAHWEAAAATDGPWQTHARAQVERLQAAARLRPRRRGPAR